MDTPNKAKMMKYRQMRAQEFDAIAEVKMMDEHPRIFCQSVSAIAVGHCEMIMRKRPRKVGISQTACYQPTAHWNHQ